MVSVKTSRLNKNLPSDNKFAIVPITTNSVRTSRPVIGNKNQEDGLPVTNRERVSKVGKHKISNKAEIKELSGKSLSIAPRANQKQSSQKFS